MPIHDWKRVSAGTFHHFHTTWLVEIARALNDGLLPSGYYAMAEQLAVGIGPDVLTLESVDANNGGAGETPNGGLSVATAPPKMRFRSTIDVDPELTVKKQLVIRHASGDRMTAIIEIISPGNKSSDFTFESLLTKLYSILRHEIHLLVIDLVPPGPRDPQGLHHALEVFCFDESAFELPSDKPLSLSSYAAGHPGDAYIEPLAVGDALIDMPLFLTPKFYVPTPLEATYQTAYQAVPERWRKVLESS